MRSNSFNQHMRSTHNNAVSAFFILGGFGLMAIGTFGMDVPDPTHMSSLGMPLIKGAAFVSAGAFMLYIQLRRWNKS